MKQPEITRDMLEFAEVLLIEHHSISLRMQGYSMYPTLQAGDVGCVTKCDPELLEVGDIVVFKANGKLVAHRLMNIKHSDRDLFFVTKGDNNRHFDTPFTSDVLVGKLVYFHRGTQRKSFDNFLMKLYRFGALRFPVTLIRLNSLDLRYRNYAKSLSTLINPTS